MTRQTVIWLALLVAVVAATAGWAYDPTAFLAAYLAAWWFWMGLCLGGLANVWLHNLSGGDWGEAVRPLLLARGSAIWFVAILFLPILAGLGRLYPWATPATGAIGWSAELGAPAFKRLWLSPAFFAARALCCLVLWTVLARLSGMPSLRRSPGFSAVALILFGLSVTVAAFDWIMSLMPLWYSSVFGLIAGTAQMLAGMALAIYRCARQPSPPSPPLFIDLGNLLLMYVMCWAYLEFVQFLIIWAANLPHEIIWYLARSTGVWRVLDWLLVVFLLVAPLLILLFRRAKQSARTMCILAASLLAMLFLHACWLVLPSLAIRPDHWLLAVPLAAVTVGALAAVQQRLFSHVEGSDG